MKKSLLLLVYLAISVFGLSQTKVAMLVGISEYPKAAKLSNISGASDTDSLEVALIQQGYIVYTLKNELATMANILKLIEKIRREHPDVSITLLHLGGHGARINGADYFLPYDYLPNASAESVLLVEDDLYYSFPSGQQLTLVLSDICRSKISIQLQLPADDPVDDPVDDSQDISELLALRTPFLTPVTPPKDTIRISRTHRFLIKSSGAGQYAHEGDLPTRKFGVFTMFFYRLLSDPSYQKQADTDQDYLLTIDEVFIFLSEQTQRYVAHTLNKSQSEQIPEIITTTGDRDIIFLKLPAPPQLKEISGESGKGNLSELEDYFEARYPSKLGVLLAGVMPKIKQILGIGQNANKGVRTIDKTADIITVFDLATYSLSEKDYALLFVHNNNVGWSEKMIAEIYYAEEMKKYVGLSGAFQIVYVDAYATDHALQHDILDKELLTDRGRSEIQPLLRTPTSPTILILKKDTEGKLWFIDKIHYTLPRNLASVLDQILDDFDTSTVGDF